MGGLCTGCLLATAFVLWRDTKAAQTPRVRWLLRGLLEEFLRPTIEFLAREILFVRCNRPLIAVRVCEGSGTIAPELIGHLAHRTCRDVGTCRNRPLEQRIAVLHVHPH